MRKSKAAKERNAQNRAEEDKIMQKVIDAHECEMARLRGERIENPDDFDIAGNYSGELY